MARRSSARLRARNSSTPQPRKVSNIQHDEVFRTPKTAPRLASLHESDEMPGAFPRSASPADDTPTKLAAHIANAVAGKYTPKQTTPIRPSAEEMHPKQFQNSTAKPLEEARWLGFSSMATHNEPPKGEAKFELSANTPSKTAKFEDKTKSPDYQFTFRAQSLELSSEAREMMAAKREEAARIKEQMIQESEAAAIAEAALGRKLATPKSKVGRFSDVHMAQFKKMDSIANHASAARTAEQAAAPVAPKSLKRTGSKADLSQGPSSTNVPKPTPSGVNAQPASSLPRSASVKSLQRKADDQSASPAKRIKRAVGDDAGTSRPTTSGSEDSGPSTPKSANPLRMHASNPHFAVTPTQSSLTRAASVKSNKNSLIPSMTRSPSKSALKTVQSGKAKPSTPLLARSPSKMALPSSSRDEPTAPASPLLARSPMKHIAKDVAEVQAPEESSNSTKIPLLARSPTKMPATVSAEGEEKPTKTPLLARSPSKIALQPNPFAGEATPAKSGSTKLMDRFKLLRQSPMKSILRSPQRLYSDDPAKIASGTHLATPPKPGWKFNKAVPAVPPKTAPVQKHVYFTASTKGDEEEPPTPTKGPTPPPKDTLQIPTQAAFSYPALPSEHGDAPSSSKKFNRRMTLGATAPGDFTFRVGGGISFGESPRSTQTQRASMSKPSIRHVSAEPEVVPSQVSKKRKLFEAFIQERNKPEDCTTAGASSDKENDDDDDSKADADREDNPRAAKRSKTSAHEPRPATTTKPSSGKLTKPAPTRVPTLGVKPKNAPKTGSGSGNGANKGPRSSMLSQARLNMLAMPKRRG